MVFIRTAYLELKLRIRKIPMDYPELILLQSKRKFRDSGNDREIFVANLLYAGKVRPMALITERRNGDILLLTIFPLTEREIVNRMRNGRWKPL